MALMTGYNFVRAGALRQFAEDYQRRYQASAEEMSILAFLRLLQHQQMPPHRHLLVSGLDRLWAACEDDDDLRTRIKQQLLTSRANWLQNNLSGVYFKLPAEVELVHGRTVQLRLPSGELVDLDVLFGGTPEQLGPDHYRRPFTMS